METYPVPVKIVTRSNGEVIKVVLRVEDDLRFAEQEPSFWIASEEEQENWDGYWRDGFWQSVAEELGESHNAGE